MPASVMDEAARKIAAQQAVVDAARALMLVLDRGWPGYPSRQDLSRALAELDKVT